VKIALILAVLLLAACQPISGVQETTRLEFGGGGR
jgi:hypothetical protein